MQLQVGDAITAQTVKAFEAECLELAAVGCLRRLEQGA